MIDSNNIEIIRDNLKELDQKIENLDVEIPPHTSGDAGKYLGVDSSGDLEFSDPLPDTTEASAGDVLGLVGESKTKAWLTTYTPRDYSTTETETGRKWIDDKPVYSVVLSGDIGEQTAQFTKIFGVINNITPIKIYGFIVNSSETVYNDIDHFDVAYSKAYGNIYASGLPVTYSEGSYYVCVEYTKDNIPTPENVTKKKKSK